ncbi:MAG: argininosuccinate synthase [bacterium]
MNKTVKKTENRFTRYFSYAVLISILLLVILFGAVPYAPALAGGTTSITITKYADNGTSILAQKAIDCQTMESTLPVRGDGITHQYLQGPTFDLNNLWDPGEKINIKDCGANKGTELKDLCELVGGMSPDDIIELKAIDNFRKVFDYPNVYTPQARQGKMVVCWWQDGEYGAGWADGMRLLFFAETKTDEKNIFGIWDAHECLPSDRWHFYDSEGIEYPTTTGLSIRNINQINIYSGQAVKKPQNTAIPSGNAELPLSLEEPTPSNQWVIVLAIALAVVLVILVWVTVQWRRRR